MGNLFPGTDACVGVSRWGNTCQKKKKKKREINILQNATIRPYTSIQAQTGELLLC